MAPIKRTQFAQAAFDYSTVFQMAFANAQVTGGCVRKPQLVAPEGMSSGGGKLVRQHLVLKPEVQGPAVVTVGAIDVSTGLAVFRTYGYLLAVHRARFAGQPFDVDSASYEAFLSRAQQFFGSQGMRVQFEDERHVPAVERGEDKNRSLKTIVMVVVAALVLFAILGFGVGGYLYLTYVR